jgi:hypothetical protein
MHSRDASQQSALVAHFSSSFAQPCPTCHHSFKLMPKSARIVGGIAIGAGLLFAWGAASLPHVYGETATMPWLLVITLLGVGFGIIGQDAYRRWRSPVIR